jgi:hypothetical protein
MRRIACSLAALGALALFGGCQANNRHWTRSASDSAGEEASERGGTGRFSRTGVPDRVMFRDQASGGFNDNPGAGIQ